MDGGYLCDHWSGVLLFTSRWRLRFAAAEGFNPCEEGSSRRGGEGGGGWAVWGLFRMLLKNRSDCNLTSSPASIGWLRPR